MADGVLAGDLALELGALGVGLVHDDLGAALELVLLQIVGAAVDVQVAVARVAEVADRETLLLTEGADVDQEGRDLVDGDDDVHLVEELGVRFDGGEEAASGCPRRLLVRARRDDEHIQRAGLLGDLAELDELLVELVLVGADERDEQRRADVGVLHALGEGRDAGEGGGRRDDIRVHELDGLRIEVRELDVRHELDAGVDVRERDEAADVADRIRDELHGHLGDDAERALGADHQVQQAVAGAGLADGLAELDDAAVREHDREREDIVARDAVLHRAHAAGVRGDVAADRRRLLAGIGRIHQAVREGVRREILQQDAGLDAHDEIVHVIVQDLVHSARAEHDAARERHAAADETRARAAAGDGDPVFIADLHDLGDFLRRFHVHRDLGEVLAVDRHLVMAVVRVDSLARGKPLFADDSLEPVGDLRGDFIIGCHAIFLLFEKIR